MSTPGTFGTAAPRTRLVHIHDLDSRGRGVGRIDGKTTFVHGALPGEQVLARRLKKRRSHDEAVAVEVVEPSSHRVEPRCSFYDRCGGCSLQHMSYEAQLRHKERVLLAVLSDIANLAPEEVMPPLAATPWRYRRKARLGARFVPGRKGALVGFRERFPGRVADITECVVLSDPFGELVMPLRALVGSLDARARIPQVEIAAGDDAAAVVIRHLDPLSEGDLAAIASFAATHGIGVWLQPGGADSARPFVHPQSEIRYSLAQGTVRLSFSPLDFVQINAQVNDSLAQRVVSMLAPTQGERVLDAFCGLGNFSLPIAARGARVTGLEVAGEMVGRARANAAANALPAEFHRADLGSGSEVRDWLRRGWDKLLVDPPRIGAEVVVEHIALARPSRIVYVSCNPDTLARDAARLVGSFGYRLRRTGLVDMFPHTSHVESVTEFERDGPDEPRRNGSDRRG